MSLARRTTHTYAVLPVRRSTFTEIRDKLIAAGYGYVFNEHVVVDDEHGAVIDMQGIAIAIDETEPAEASDKVSG